MKKGFTFVEMAVVLVVIGILSGFGTMKLVTSMAQARYNAEENNKLKNLAGAIVHHTAASPTKTLPDDRNFADLARGYFFDRIAQFSRASNESICSLPRTDLVVELCTTKDCSQFDTIDNVIFIVALAGLNLSTETDITSKKVRIPASGMTDDFIKFVTLPEMKANIGCGGGLKIVTDSLPKITADGRNFKDINITAEQGVPTNNDWYWWCIEMKDGERFFTPTGTSRTRPHVDNTFVKGLKECTDSFFLDKKNIQIIQGSQFDKTVKLPSGNYPFTVIAKDTANTKVEKEVILTVTDLVHMPDHNDIERVSKKYACITVADNSSGDINICRSNSTDPNKRYCVVKSIDESEIATLKTCADSINKLYTPKTGIK